MMTQAKSTPASGFGRHGGRIDEAMIAWPDAPRPWIDLSTGINPVPWPVPAALSIDPGPLPSVAALRGLEAAAAAHFGLQPHRVTAVPGSEVALRLLPLLGVVRPVIAATPGYGTHVEVADGAVGFDALAAAGAGTIILANPNNPDGRMTDLSALIAGHRGWTVVDEAFADAMPGTSVASTLSDDARVIVLRSFGKFFGLAGLRLGFVIGPPAVVARVRQLVGDWPVSTQAIAWGTAAYRDRRWIATTREALMKRAGTLDTLLARHGLMSEGACPLFRLVHSPDAQAVFARLARAGILTRPFDGRPDWLRLGLPADAAAFERLDRALGRG
ncbi:aminotransferase class I/II-fold pyridoxal phosphate-dependent enzyme [Sphingomonas sp.]|uniref:aminotransferase class I/II-fold pyridoxal phosphate-dependent enzyme n=1 Tax=Sphingomonas sp. TaxID=28214 RepID=UPI002C73B85A|nr:aminotransferase class I/II-fold pyridoxal phosphate-dependent enzyme [Sphingomonas sp.]HTG38754.1 aminotransferase class I/II-fold pyridoxal phosphate-dependent enzyme [Sphingomonas sp.]